MSVIAVVNQKGGVGKTWLATNLAAALVDQGQILLLYADVQRSALGWYGLNSQPPLALDVRGVE